MAATVRMAVGLSTMLVVGGGVLLGMQGRQPAAVAQEGGTAAAPALKGQQAGGGSFDLRDLQGSPAVLVFYRGAYCPLCVERLESLVANKAAYERTGARIVAVTADPPEIASSTQRGVANGLTIVSADEATLRAWDVWPDGAPAPMPAEFVLDADGSILFEHRGRSAADDAGDVRLLGVLRDRLVAQRSASR